MLKNCFTIAWRNLMKNKVFSFINIFGLTTGLTVCLMIFLFVMNEFQTSLLLAVRRCGGFKDKVQFSAGKNSFCLI